MKKINYVYCCIVSAALALLCIVPNISDNASQGLRTASIIVGLFAALAAMGFLYLHLNRAASPATDELENKKMDSNFPSEAFTELKMIFERCINSLLTIAKNRSIYFSLEELMEAYTKKHAGNLIKNTPEADLFFNDPVILSQHLISSVESDPLKYAKFREAILLLSQKRKESPGFIQLRIAILPLLETEISKETDALRKQALEQFKSQITAMQPNLIDKE